MGCAIRYIVFIFVLPEGPGEGSEAMESMGIYDGMIGNVTVGNLFAPNLHVGS